MTQGRVGHPLWGIRALPRQTMTCFQSLIIAIAHAGGSNGGALDDSASSDTARKTPAGIAAGTLNRDPDSGSGRNFLRLVGCAGAFEAIVIRRLELHRLGHAGAVGGIALSEQRDLPALDLDRHALHRRSDVVEQTLLLLGVDQAIQVAGLRVVVIAVAVVVAIGITVQRGALTAKAWKCVPSR